MNLQKTFGALLVILVAGCASTTTYLDAKALKVLPAPSDAWLIRDLYEADRDEVLRSKRTSMVQMFGPARSMEKNEYKLERFNFVTAQPPETGKPTLKRFLKIQITRKIELAGMAGTVTEFEVDKKIYHTYDLITAKEDLSFGGHYSISLEYPKIPISTETGAKVASRKRQEEMEKLKNGPSGKFYESVKNKRLAAGLPEELLLFGWGEPEKINVTTGPWGVHKQYVYLSRMVYVQNGFVTSWQE